VSTRQQPIDLWEAFNERQRRYLTAVYDGDQAAESRNKGGAFDWGSRRPASEWRWLVYGLKAPKELVGRTPMQYALAAVGEHDQGAGSSLAALRRRALIELYEDHVLIVLGMVPRVRVKLTTLGRATARAARSISSGGYFRWAGMDESFQGSAPSIEPGAVISHLPGYGRLLSRPGPP
jgi:hypothetical protein